MALYMLNPLLNYSYIKLCQPKLTLGSNNNLDCIVLKMFLYYSIVFNIPTPPVRTLLECSPNQISFNCWFLMKGENQSSQKRTSQTQVENQQIQSIWCQVCDLKPVPIGVRQVLASVFIYSLYLLLITWGVVAQSPEPGAHVKNA